MSAGMVHLCWDSPSDDSSDDESRPTLVSGSGSSDDSDVVPVSGVQDGLSGLAGLEHASHTKPALCGCRSGLRGV